MDDKKLVIVRNRNNGSTGYTLPDSNVKRTFAPGESKKISIEELQSLQYAPGGDYILKNLLIIEDDIALDNLNMQVEPEYFFDEKRIRELLLDNDNMDSFLDFLDFAPDGAIEIAKDIAVKEQIPDSRKRDAISKKTGFNIDKAIEINKIMTMEDETPKENSKKERRVKAEVKKEENNGRRTAKPTVAKPTANFPEYKVISTGK